MRERIAGEVANGSGIEDRTMDITEKGNAEKEPWVGVWAAREGGGVAKARVESWIQGFSSSR